MQTQLTQDQFETITQTTYTIAEQIDNPYIQGAMNAFRFLQKEDSAEEVAFLLTFILLNPENPQSGQSLPQSFAQRFSPYGISPAKLQEYCRVICSLVTPVQREGLTSVLPLQNREEQR